MPSSHVSVHFVAHLTASRTWIHLIARLNRPIREKELVLSPLFRLSFQNVIGKVTKVRRRQSECPKGPAGSGCRMEAGGRNVTTTGSSFNISVEGKVLSYLYNSSATTCHHNR